MWVEERSDFIHVHKHLQQ